MRNRSERGSFTIEAILSLSIFMFAFVTIVSLATIAKVESTTQYAIDQVAKEISQYYYIAERVGVANTGTEGVEEIDDAVQAIFDFADKSSNVASNYSSTTAADLGTMIENMPQISNDVHEVSAAAENVYNSFGPIFEDPKGIVSSLATMMVKQVGNELITKVIAQPLCKALVPKYITSNGDADAILEKMGVVDGLDGLDFRMSSFLSDQRSINVVVVYQIKVNGFGIFDDTLVIKQTASTAAWVKGTSLKASNAATSNWEKGDLERGKEYVDEVQGENPHKAVKEGVGVDIYDQDTNTFTSIHSMNVFSATYSDYQKVAANDADPSNYSLKKSKIKSTVKGYANKLLDNVNKIDENITMEDGTQCQTALESVKHRNTEIILVVPEEAKSNADNLAILNEIAAEIEAETGVKVNITYRDKALD